MKHIEYEPEIKSETDEETKIYSFESADGVPSKDGFRESELLIADVVEPVRNDDVLVVQAGFGFLGVAMAEKTEYGVTTVAETGDRAHQLIQRNLEKNDVDGRPVKISFYSDLDDEYDQIVYAPRGYEPVDVVKERLAHLVDQLAENGELFIAGKKTSGMNRYEDFLKDMNGEIRKVLQDGPTRLYRFSGEKGDVEVPDTETGFSAEVEGSEIEFSARKGLFSSHGLDEASRLLIENTDVSKKDEVLDLACGYGAIGIFLKELHDSDVSFTDDSATATYYTEKNLEKNDMEGEIDNKDCLDAYGSEEFDVIVSNPPSHQGESVTQEMFSESSKVLRPEGTLYIVYNSNMKFEKDLERYFNKVEKVVEEDGFTVTRAVR